MTEQRIRCFFYGERSGNVEAEADQTDDWLINKHPEGIAPTTKKKRKKTDKRKWKKKYKKRRRMISVGWKRNSSLMILLFGA